jgi:hypothetical protein
VTDDFGACNPWPPGFSDKLNSFRQGHIIGDVPVFFLQDATLWARSRQAYNNEPSPILVGEEGHPRRRGMLLTQACDLMRHKNPWITVAPVYDASGLLNAGQHGQVKSGQIFHLVHITAEWGSSGLWVADLRLELPIEKTFLINQEPVEAFSDEAQYATLAQRLGARRQRLPAPQSCLDLVVDPLFDALRSLPDGGAALNEPVFELRVSSNDPNVPTVVTVFVVAADEDARAQVDVNGWTDLLLSLYERAQSEGMTIVGPEVTSMDDMSAADYVQSSPIEDTQSS